MRLVHGIRQILCLGGESHAGRPFFREPKSFIIPSLVEVLCQLFMMDLGSVGSVTFEAGCRLQRIEELAFSWNGLTSIVISSSAEVLCKSCFHGCESLSSITFESVSQLQRIEESAFSDSGLTSLIIPS
jgi:hypothetical protein